MSNDFLEAAEEVEDQIDHLYDTIPDQMESAQQRTAGDAVRNVVENDSVATSLLRNNIHVKDLPASQVLAEIGSGSLVTSQTIIAATPYAGYVERGTGTRGLDVSPHPAPDNPPVKDIFTWIQAKGITSQKYPDPLDLAYAIAETIESFGTYGHPFLTPAIRQARGTRRYRRAIRSAFSDAEGRLRV